MGQVLRNKERLPSKATAVLLGPLAPGAAMAPAPPISVDGNVIVEGAHRYVAEKILDQEPSAVPGSLSPSQAPLAYPIRDIKVDPTEDPLRRMR
jgi:hypothetical protein